VAGSPVISRRRGAFSTLLRRPGLRASSDGVLTTKSECKMLARKDNDMLVLALCLVYLFKHQRQRAQATYMLLLSSLKYPSHPIDIISAMMIVWRIRRKLSELFHAVLCTTVVHNDTHTHVSAVITVECWF